MEQQEPIQTEYNEIDLMDYVKVLLNRKWLILAVFFGAAIAAGIFSFIMPKVYKIDTSLQMGQIGLQGGVPIIIENPTQVIAKIQGDSYGVLIRKDLNIPENEYPKIKVDNSQGTSLINIEINSSNTGLAKSILEKINDLIIGDNQEEIKNEKDLIQKNIQTLGQNIDISKKDIERINAKIGSLEEERNNLQAKVGALQEVLPYQQDPGTQFALFNTKEELASKKQEIENTYLEINSTQEKINSIQSQIDSLSVQLIQIKPDEVIKSPIVSENPISPRLLLNIVIAAILGLFLGIFVAFAGEWWKKSSRELNA